METKIMQLRQLVTQAKRIVFFGGAGVSTESGIPDFRSANGIFRQGGVISPEEIVSRPFFDACPEEFFDFYRKKLVYPDAKPNAAHKVLAAWEQAGKLSCVITQNIDGLHQQAGSKRVLELHGSVLRNHCMRCKKAYGVEAVTGCNGVPRCTCGGTVKPDVVLYGESLDQDVLTQAVEELQQADLLLIAGTSLRVYPAAGLVRYFRGNALVVINYDPTDADRNATLCINDAVGKVLASL